MAYRGKFKLVNDYQFDIPNGGSGKLPKGTVVEGIVLMMEENGQRKATGISVETRVNGSIANIDIPMEYLKPHEESKKPEYNWLYLLLAGGLVFWYVSRDKKKRTQAAPAGFTGI
jgi:hypothetical protein